MKESASDPRTDELRTPLGDVYDRDCPSRGVLEHVTSRWGVLVLIALLDGTHRFSELRRRVSGVSEKMLAQTLQTLERDGFVHREARPVIPPHVDYSLTVFGVEAAEQVRELAHWVEVGMERVTRSRAAYDRAKAPREGAGDGAERSAGSGTAHRAAHRTGSAAARGGVPQAAETR